MSCRPNDLQTLSQNQAMASIGGTVIVRDQRILRCIYQQRSLEIAHSDVLLWLLLC